ncbi:transmembrane protein 255B isoform X1 [Girardinichthys multiradiatus]|uniref:transmembrane protein 255B isoform X1 n=1 Tax=Girardinichthys multiradiatus TaxID=208333 RepID=UPI001FADB70B|nr:transmembrane protein 255B isoform X1 [Girardinichthys multiradiatus]
MQQPETQQMSQQTATETLDSAGLYIRRGKTALWLTVSLLALALVVLTIGLISATRTDNVPVSGYYPGITLSFGAFLGIVAIHLVENRRPMLVAAIIFISIGVIAAFFCAIVDGIIASEFIDIRPLQEDMCDYHSSGSGYAYDNYHNEVTCRSFSKACKMKVRSNTCFCCYLYNCESTEYQSHYYEFTGVGSCWDVIHLHRLLWASVVLNVVALFLGIIDAAVLGAYKDMQKPTPQVAPSAAPHILYNPTQHMLSYTGFCPPGQALPAYPNYPIPMQHTSSYQAPATPQMIPEGGSGVCPSEESQNQQPTQVPTQPQPQGATQDPGGYMLTPNAPILYGSSYSPFEKPPPYAC